VSRKSLWGSAIGSFLSQRQPCPIWPRHGDANGRKKRTQRGQLGYIDPYAVKQNEDGGLIRLAKLQVSTKGAPCL
jgi:hypothetical protein